MVKRLRRWLWNQTHNINIQSCTVCYGEGYKISYRASFALVCQFCSGTGVRLWLDNEFLNPRRNLLRGRVPTHATYALDHIP